jgi:hypothetical protein
MSETTGFSPFFANYGFHPRMGVEPSQPRPPKIYLNNHLVVFHHFAERPSRLLPTASASAGSKPLAIRSNPT